MTKMESNKSLRIFALIATTRLSYLRLHGFERKKD